MKLLDQLVSSIVSPPAFGLDISDFTVKFVKFTRSLSGGLIMEAFGEIVLPEGTVVEGEIKKEAELISVLKNNLVTTEGQRFSERFVAATLPEEKGFVHALQLPKMRPEDARKAARWEIEGIVPLPPEELYFDYAILSPTKDSLDHMDLLVTAFPRTIVDSYVRVLEEAGFSPVSLELESQAISRSLWSGEKEALIFVDLGATRTSFMTVVQESLIFTRSIPVGGKDFERSIAERLGVSKEEAKKIKIEVGLAKDYQGGAVYAALLPLVSALADELKKHVLFYREHSTHRHGMPGDILRVVLSGGDANLTNLTNYLSVVLKKEVRIGNPLSRLFLEKHFAPPFSKNESLKYTTAIGAALRGVGL